MILCPGCGVHVKKAAACEMTCPFCDATFGLECAKSGGLGQTALRGVVAASIVGATMFGAGCREDPFASAVYGVPADISFDADDTTDDAASDTATEADAAQDAAPDVDEADTADAQADDADADQADH
ncbi:MAG: hypothetical protein H0U74_13085 [Bradymonadaceae bacterium]|nr:hypothetical protein [Lujinxingiaceae bacterium]